MIYLHAIFPIYRIQTDSKYFHAVKYLADLERSLAVFQFEAHLPHIAHRLFVWHKRNSADFLPY